MSDASPSLLGKASASSCSETDITWTTAPSPGSLLGSGSPSSVGWVEIALDPSYFQGGGFVSLVLVNGGTNSTIIASSEAGDPPQLVLTQ